jgi:hypothetical protein
MVRRYAVGKLYVLIARRTPMILHEWEITCAKMALFVINLLFFPITSGAINAFRCSKDPATGISYNAQYPKRWGTRVSGERSGRG